MTSDTKNTTLPASARKPRRTHGTRQAITDAAGSPGEAAGASPAADPTRQTSDPAPDLQPKKAPSKASLVLQMLQRPTGATLAQMVGATGWLPHTTRAMLTGLKKKGHAVTSEKLDGVRTYRVATGNEE